MIDADSIAPSNRPVLRQSQREAIRAVEEQKAQLRRKITAARKAHRIYVADLQAQIDALPTRRILSRQYGVSEPVIAYVGRGRQYKNANILDEREARA